MDSNDSVVDGRAERRIRELGGGTLAAFVFAYLTAAALALILLYNAGVWNVLANTRLLSPLIDGGIVALTDADNGLLVPDGIPDLDDYVASQDPVDWLLVLLATGLFGVVLALNALRFHALARFVGTGGRFGQSARAYAYGRALHRLLPFRVGEVASAAALEGQGVPLDRAAQVVGLARTFVMFEIVTFATVGLLLNGPATWVAELFWPLVILLGARLLTRPGRNRADHKAGRAEALAGARATLTALAATPRTTLRIALLSLISFLLLDIGCYVVSQAFTSANVIINVEFSVITMGIVGGFVATLIPVTPGGIGQWECGMAAALHAGGLGFPECVTLAALFTAVRYAAGGAVFAAVLLGPGVETSLGRVLTLARGEGRPASRPAGATGAAA